MQKRTLEIIEKIGAKFTPINQSKDPEEWKRLRTTGIGGSDAGAILGLNKYSSPLTVYFQKKEVKGFEGNLATEWGQILEDPIRKKTESELNIKIHRIEGMFTSNVFTFANANLDGIVEVKKDLEIDNVRVSGIGGHEIKTSGRGDGFAEDEIPDSYYCQVQHYMAVTNLEWFLLTVFFLDKKKAKHYIVKKNQDFIDTLMEKEREFWFHNVLPEIIPAPLGIAAEDDYIKNLPISEVVELNDNVNSLIKQQQEVNNKIKELEKENQALKNSILIELSKGSENQNAENTTATTSNFIITYNTQSKKSVDTEKLKAENLYEKFTKTSSYKVLRIKEKKA